MSKRKKPLKRRPRVVWPPPSKKLRIVRGVQWNQAGDASHVLLQRQPYDAAISGHLQNTCCDCGAVHLITLEVYRQRDGTFYLKKRSYKFKKGKKRR